MITRVFFAARRRDLTTEACLEHWRGHHAEMGARLPHLRAYVQNHGVLNGGRFLLPYPGFDIMPENDWDDLTAMDGAIESPAHGVDLLSDEPRFLDTSRTSFVVTERHVLDEAESVAEPVKLITLLRRSPTASQSDFQTALLKDYSKAISDRGRFRHEVLITIPDRPGRPPFTVQGIDVLWFNTPRDAVMWTTSEIAYRAAWHLSGVAAGSERLVARPYKVL